MHISSPALVLFKVKEISQHLRDISATEQISPDFRHEGAFSGLPQLLRAPHRVQLPRPKRETEKYLTRVYIRLRLRADASQEPDPIANKVRFPCGSFCGQAAEPAGRVIDRPARTKEPRTK